MKPKSVFAFAILGLSVASSGAFAGPSEEAAPYGKQLTSIDDVAKSRPGSFDVYIDGPTGFAFVHTPFGWTFTRKVTQAPEVAEKVISDDYGKVAGTIVPAQ